MLSVLGGEISKLGFLFLDKTEESEDQRREVSHWAAAQMKKFHDVWIGT